MEANKRRKFKKCEPKIKNLMKTKIKNKALGFLTLFSLLVAWEIVGRTAIVNPIFTSYPSQVVVSLLGLLKDSTFYPNALISFNEFAVGFVIAVVLGVVLGLLLGWFGILERLFDSTITIFYITPIIVFLPLFIVWFGVTFLSKVIIVFALTFFPVLINTQSGVKAVDKNLVRVAKSFGASQFQTLRGIVLPSTTPFILSGIRLGIGRALIGVIVAEFYGANGGLGYLLALYGSTFQIGKYMAIILIMIVVGLFLNQTVYYFERKRSKL